MATQPISIAVQESEKQQVTKLYRMLLRDGIPALLGPSGEKEDLTESVYKLLRDVLGKMQEGRSVAIVPLMEELTTQKAADILGLSRQFLVRLLEADKIPYHRAGTHRRIYLKDVLEYRRHRDAHRRTGIRQIAQTALDVGDYGTFVPPESR
jgi:excisionase family DNA binding protein